MSQILKPVERVENVIWNMVDGAGYKEETFFEFERTGKNKTIFRMKYITLPDKLIRNVLETVCEMYPYTIIRPLNEKEIELRVY